MEDLIRLKDYRVSPEPTGNPQQWLLVHPKGQPLVMEAAGNGSIDLYTSKMRLWISDGFTPALGARKTLELVITAISDAADGEPDSSQAAGERIFKALLRQATPRKTRCKKGDLEEMKELLSLLAETSTARFVAVAGCKDKEPTIEPTGMDADDLLCSVPTDVFAVASDIVHWHLPYGSTLAHARPATAPLVTGGKDKSAQIPSSERFGTGADASAHLRLELAAKLQEFYAEAMDDLGLSQSVVDARIAAVL